MSTLEEVTRDAGLTEITADVADNAIDHDSVSTQRDEPFYLEIF